MGEEDEESQESEELDSEDDFNPDYVQKANQNQRRVLVQRSI